MMDGLRQNEGLSRAQITTSSHSGGSILNSGGSLFENTPETASSHRQSVLLDANAAVHVEVVLGVGGQALGGFELLQDNRFTQVEPQLLVLRIQGNC